MTNQEIQDAIRVLSREKECVQQAIEKSTDGSGYVSPDGLINADDYVNACSLAITALSLMAGKDLDSTHIRKFHKWCENQNLDETGRVMCLAHLAESRVFDCPYKNNQERLTAEYPCSDYKEVKT